jgi:hypothetical protein
MMLRLKLQQPHHVKRVNIFSRVTIKYLFQISLESRGMHVKVKNLNGGSHLYSWGRKTGFPRQCSRSRSTEASLLNTPLSPFPRPNLLLTQTSV